MESSDQRLLSTQVQVYALYDAEDLINVSPNSNRWYPESATRINYQYLFYLLSFSASIAAIVWPVVRYKGHPFFIDLIPIKWGSHFLLFSYWMLILHAVFYFTAAVDLRLRYHPISEGLHAVKERLYDAVFSLTCLQFVVFWAFVFRERISNLGEGTVTWEIWFLDFLSNLVPFLCIIIETVIVHHRFAKTLCNLIYEVIFPMIFYGAYVLFSFYAHKHNDHWPYPIQNRTEKNHQGLILFYTCGCLVLILGYVVAKTITRFLWADAPKENPEEDIMHSFTTASVFSSFTNDGNNKHYIQPQRQQQQHGAESLVVGSPQTSYNGYGTVDPYNNGKGYY